MWVLYIFLAIVAGLGSLAVDMLANRESPQAEERRQLTWARGFVTLVAAAAAVWSLYWCVATIINLRYKSG